MLYQLCYVLVLLDNCGAELWLPWSDQESGRGKFGHCLRQIAEDRAMSNSG